MREFTRAEVEIVIKTYGRWLDMLHRCNLPSNKNYKNYGGRGIKVCDEWQGGKEGFFNFFEYVSKLPHFGEEGYSLDRINVNGNYESNNIRWATAKVQSNNRRKSIIVTDLDGSKISLSAAAEKYELTKNCIYSRFRFGDRGERLFRPTFKKFTVDGKSISEWAKITGISVNTIRNRYNKGWRGQELVQPLIYIKRPKESATSGNA